MPQLRGNFIIINSLLLVSRNTINNPAIVVCPCVLRVQFDHLVEILDRPLIVT